VLETPRPAASRAPRRQVRRALLPPRIGVPPFPFAKTSARDLYYRPKSADESACAGARRGRRIPLAHGGKRDLSKTLTGESTVRAQPSSRMAGGGLRFRAASTPPRFELTSRRAPRRRALVCLEHAQEASAGARSDVGDLVEDSVPRCPLEHTRGAIRGAPVNAPCSWPTLFFPRSRHPSGIAARYRDRTSFRAARSPLDRACLTSLAGCRSRGEDRVTPSLDAERRDGPVQRANREALPDKTDGFLLRVHE